MIPLVALLCGAIFGIGLAISGMTDTHVVLGFLDIFGAWNPALVFVMGGAVLATLVGFHLVLRRSKPLLGEKFSLPANQHIDKRLLIGTAIFGIGWGLYGYCPGPAISSLAYLRPETFLFVAAMLAGMWLEKRLRPLA